MILISAGLVLAAVILLIAGFVLATPFLIMWSIVVSVLSALFLVIGAFLRRHELFPGGGRAAAPAAQPAGLMPGSPHGQTATHGQTTTLGQAGPAPARYGPVQHGPVGAPPSMRPRTLQQTAPVPPSGPRRPAARGISPDSIVLVIPGRKRYHLPGCRQLAGREHEELTYEEAREEGFTPCTTCLPDAALGGRQLPSVAGPEPAVPPKSGATASSPPSRPAPPGAPAESRAESRIEPAEGTRDRGTPAPADAVKPKPGSKASTPSPGTGADTESEATGWFGRPGDATTSPAPSGKPGTSSTGTSSTGRPGTSSTGTPSMGRPGTPSAGETAGTGTPSTGKTASGGASSRGEGASGGASSKGEGGSGGAAKPAVSRGSAPTAGEDEADVQTSRFATGARPSTPGAKPVSDRPEAAERPSGKRPAGRPASRPDDDASDLDDPGPATRPQRAVQAGDSGPQRSAPTGRSSARPTSPAAKDTPPRRPEPETPTTATGTQIFPVAVSPSKDRRSEAERSGSKDRRSGDERPGSEDRRPGDERRGSEDRRPGGERPGSEDRRSGSEGERSGGDRSETPRPSAADTQTFKAEKPRTTPDRVVPERPASSAESDAKPKGPLPKDGPSAKPERPAPGGTGDSAATARPAAAGGAKDPAPSRSAGEAGDAPESKAGDAPESKDASSTRKASGGPETASGKPKSPGTGKSETKEEGKPDKSGQPITVKVIVGTRRYHSTECPLIRGAGETGVETMSIGAAEAAGLTSCSVCQHDRETV